MVDEVIDFWFSELDPKMWWTKSEQLDALILERFGLFHARAVQSELVSWRGSAMSSLAEIIILDQFSRNIYRDRPESFASDPLALALAQLAVSKGFDMQVDEVKRSFFYLPFMHSESPLIHETALALYEKLGDPDKLNFEMRHKAIIDEFGRYPHRNAILGRVSTEEELRFLEQPGSSF